MAKKKLTEAQEAAKQKAKEKRALVRANMNEQEVVKAAMVEALTTGADPQPHVDALKALQEAHTLLTTPALAWINNQRVVDLGDGWMIRAWHDAGSGPVTGSVVLQHDSANICQHTGTYPSETVARKCLGLVMSSYRQAWKILNDGQ